MHKLRQLCMQHDFLKSGDTAEQTEASLSELLVKRLFLEWGLAEVRGLRIDGQPATVETIVNRGPEDLSDEMLEQIQQELGLTEQERKNS